MTNRWTLGLFLALLLSGLFSIALSNCQNAVLDYTSEEIDPIASYYEANKGNDLPSISHGTVGNGSLENGKLIPWEGIGYRYFDTASYLGGRAFLNDKVLASILDGFKALNGFKPIEEGEKKPLFRVMECSHQKGGKLYPHRTHQNGTSVDLMMPKLKNGQDYNELDDIGSRHYFLNFSDQGILDSDTSVQINFEKVASMIMCMNKGAQLYGYKVSKVIIKIEYKDALFAGPVGQKLKSSGIYIVKSLGPQVNAFHDEHIHLDFEKL